MMAWSIAVRASSERKRDWKRGLRRKGTDWRRGVWVLEEWIKRIG